jgi:hypothetical protein
MWLHFENWLEECFRKQRGKTAGPIQKQTAAPKIPLFWPSPQEILLLLPEACLLAIADYNLSFPPMYFTGDSCAYLHEVEN